MIVFSVYICIIVLCLYICIFNTCFILQGLYVRLICTSSNKYDITRTLVLVCCVDLWHDKSHFGARDLD